jgi:hypothetical protein
MLYAFESVPKAPKCPEPPPKSTCSLFVSVDNPSLCLAQICENAVNKCMMFKQEPADPTKQFIACVPCGNSTKLA